MSNAQTRKNWTICTENKSGTLTEGDALAQATKLESKLARDKEAQYWKQTKARTALLSAVCHHRLQHT